ncbi:MAG TPA: 1-acyl-sn-glycerol-3-phosphate acyltransferase [Accumulibacter sp.]|jgi:1-acyl-sn-glycerol-3-phosphate acyltransferase|nr:1-acyl-sn-glycerol-3-phosphate acyltransferase [Accumulibacter sp.]HPP46244.1 1-acyl-sn-glycerol-3-phosphate acyltransferase [Accumulibacter sp.]
MHRTIFHSAALCAFLRALSRLIFRVRGWRIEGMMPANALKCVMIAAPHTSNWDLPYTLMAAFVLRLPIYWLGKQSIFRPPFGGLMMWLGGIPVNRQQSTRLVAGTAAAIKEATGKLCLVVSPEGTRSRTREWKSGFYFIALEAELPIVMAYLDYARRVAGIGPVFVPTGDFERDMAAIKAFYTPIKGRKAALFDSET